MFFKILDISHKINVLILLLVTAFISPFISRFFPLFDKLTIVLYLGLSLLLLTSDENNFRINNLLVLAICSSFIFYFLVGLGFYYLFELTIWFSFFGFLLVEKKLFIKYHRILLYVLIFFSSIQILFDFLFPVLNADNILDRYTGTFIMPNNKSRYLLFLLVFMLTAKLKMNKILKIICMLSITISMIMGHSTFGLLFTVIALLSGKFIKNFFLFLFFSILGFGFTVRYVCQNYSNNEILLMNYNRYFDEDHGVYAIYKYGFKKLEQSDFLGVGFGNFSSRAGQFIGSQVTNGIPETMINYNKDLNSTKTPYGLSSIYVLFIEMGVFSLPIIWFIFKKLWELKSNCFWGYFSFYYLFFIMNYCPTFFEFSEGSLFLFTFLITNYYIKYRKHGYYSPKLL